MNQTDFDVEPFEFPASPWQQMILEGRLPKEQGMRDERDARLRDSDFRMVSDAPWDTAAWATYRQALRDLPSDAAWPDVEFPEAPEGV